MQLGCGHYSQSSVSHSLLIKPLPLPQITTLSCRENRHPAHFHDTQISAGSPCASYSFHCNLSLSFLRWFHPKKIEWEVMREGDNSREEARNKRKYLFKKKQLPADSASPRNCLSNSWSSQNALICFRSSCCQVSSIVANSHDFIMTLMFFLNPPPLPSKACISISAFIWKSKFLALIVAEKRLKMWNKWTLKAQKTED